MKAGQEMMKQKQLPDHRKKLQLGKKIYLLAGLVVFMFCLPALSFAQQGDKKNLGDDKVEVVKPYKPVLVESFKIPENPVGDTTTSNPPSFEYNLRAKKAETEFETSVIRAVNIKDEQLAKLYRTYLKLGIGNYTTYSGDLYVNALRSKKGALGFQLNHFSGSPGLDDVGFAGFSNNHGGVYGKYFFDHTTFEGSADYNRDVFHYYGYDADKVILSKDDIKQRFNKFGMQMAFGSNYLTRDHIDYSVGFGFRTLNDLYDVTESDLMISGNVGRKISDYDVKVDASFNYFKKSLAKDELLTLNNDLNRSLVNLTPTLSFRKDKLNLTLGFNAGIEKNLGTKVHFFPRIDLNVPMVENILYVFAGVNGRVKKNSYQTIVEENPYVMPSVDPFNTIEKLSLSGGLRGNFSTLFSFVAMVKYTSIDRLLLYYKDVNAFNQFNVLYADGNVLNLHGELAYKSKSNFTASLRFDQYSYSLDGGEKAWNRPNTEVALNMTYSLWEKIILKGDVYAFGKYDARLQQGNGFSSVKVSGYMDASLGFEYRYSKVLSFFINMNNLGFSRHYYWHEYPSERLNVLGGITFSM